MHALISAMSNQDVALSPSPLSPSFPEVSNVEPTVQTAILVDIGEEQDVIGKVEESKKEESEFNTGNCSMFKFWVQKESVLIDLRPVIMSILKFIQGFMSPLFDVTYMYMYQHILY